MGRVMGLTRPRSGSVRYKGKEISGVPPYKIAKLGIGFVPEDRVIFPDLTVLDNFMVGAKKGADQNEQWTTQKLFDLFPVRTINNKRHFPL